MNMGEQKITKITEITNIAEITKITKITVQKCTNVGSGNPGKDSLNLAFCLEKARVEASRS